MKLRNIAAGTLMLLGFAVVNSFAQSESVEEFTMRITQELSTRNSEAAELFTAANLAREQGNWGNAEELYKRVRALVPDFYHATRRLCYVVLEQGRRDEAVAYSREALTYAESPENLQAIIMVLIDQSSGTLTAVEREEVSHYSEDLLSREDINPGYLTVVCESALIDAYPGLTNIIGGTGGVDYGAMHAKEIIRRYSA